MEISLMFHRPDPSSFPSASRQSRWSLHSMRKFALMATVVGGLGAGAYGLAPSFLPGSNVFSSANAQVSNEVGKVQRPVGFADIVERVKPSVISVRVNIREKADSNNRPDDAPFPPGSPMERFFRRFGGPDGFPGFRGPRQVTG